MLNKKNGIIFIAIISVKLGLTLLLYGNEITLVSPSYAQQKTDAPPSPALKGGEAGLEEKKAETASEIDLELLKSFEKKREELAKKENEIKLKEEQLNMIQQSIQQKLNELAAIKSDIEKLVILRKDLEEKSINHLVKVYSSMPPAEAASHIEKLDRDITIQILSRMKGKSAAKILSNINPAAAVQISEQIVKKKPPKQPAEEQKK
jgi:flagellar motility protein MotE (MotC chaperone)